jgi:N-acetylmuramoyl-L-alanine amidase
MRSFGRPIAVAALFAAAVSVRAQAPTAEASYKAALAQEAEVRQRMEKPSAASAAARTELLRSVRNLVKVYDAIAINHPTSGYSDNALWQGALLSADAFWQFGQAVDRDTARRMMQAMAARFPTSSLVPRVDEQIARLERRPAGTASTSKPAAKPASAPAGPASQTAPASSPAASAGKTTSSSSAATSASRTTPASSTAETAPKTPSGPSTLTEITREVLPDAVRVTLALEHETPFATERLDNPARLVVDLHNTRSIYDLKDARLAFNGDVVRQVRVGRQDDGRIRVVLDLESAGRHSIYPVYNPYRLIIDFERPGKTGSTPSLVAATGPPRSTVPPASTGAAGRSGAAGSAGRGTTAATGTTTSKAPPARTPGIGPAPPPSRNTKGGYSISRQLGLGVSRIVIDPGHGGHDPGARVNGLTEAELVLDVAVRLEKLLLAQPEAEVVLTRRTSEFIPLEERTKIANRVDADLFISIHANASTNTAARGIETYFLNFAQDEQAEAVAARENASSSRTMSALNDMVKAITFNNKIDESRDFARLVQNALFTGLRKTNKQARDLGVKQAPFQVLIGAAMPSILAEISFITNSQEGKLLKTAKYRDEIAVALFNGIVNYQKEVKKGGAVAKK